MRIRFWVWSALLAASFTCHGGDDASLDALPSLVRLTPTNVSIEDGWHLFDRSISSGHAPTAQPIHVALGGRLELAAIKVFGPSPYRLSVSSVEAAIDLPAIDLSSITGWRSIPLPVTTVSTVELAFEPLGEAGQVPELELWGSGSNAPTESKAGAATQIAAGRCASFSVELAARPEHLRRAELVYDSVGILRGFELSRRINGGPVHGGGWVGGSLTERTNVEAIDPASLHTGINEISLCAPDAAGHDIAIDKLHLVTHVDDGRQLPTRVLDERTDVTRLVGDRDPSSKTTIQKAHALRVDFERLIAPDLVVLDGTIGDVAVQCIGRNGDSSSLTSITRATDTGAVLVVDGGRAACRGLQLAFADGATIAELDVVGSGAADRVDWPHAVVTSAAEHFGDVGWVGGYVARPAAMTTAVRVSLDGRTAQSLSGDFGMLLQRANTPGLAWRVPLHAAFPDGTDESLDVTLDLDRRADLPTKPTGGGSGSSPESGGVTPATSAFGIAGQSTSAHVTQLVAAEVRLGRDVGVDVPAGALQKPTDIVVKHLDDAVLPPLEAGMINVTAPENHGYEFLPHGQTFQKAVEIVLPYNPALVPEGMTVDDIHAFFYDPVDRKWVKLPRRAIDLGAQITRSTTTHFTVMVNAVLAVPKSPSVSSFDGSSLAVAAASPVANIDMIEPPAATSSGDARLALPLRLPAGRGAHSRRSRLAIRARVGTAGSASAGICRSRTSRSIRGSARRRTPPTRTGTIPSIATCSMARRSCRRPRPTDRAVRMGPQVGAIDRVSKARSRTCFAVAATRRRIASRSSIATARATSTVAMAPASRAPRHITASSGSR